MKFYFGETDKAKRSRLSDWHDCFALFPVHIGEEDGKHVCVWLEVFQQREVWRDLPSTGFGYYEWEYRRKE